MKPPQVPSPSPASPLEQLHQCLPRLDRLAGRHPACALQRYGRLEDGLRALEQAEGEAAPEQARQALALRLDLLYRRFQLAERLGRAQELSAALSAAMGEAVAAHLSRQAACIHEAQGRLAYQMGEYFAATEHWSDALDLARLCGDVRLGVAARIGLGQIHYALGAWDKGRRFHRDAAEQLDDLDDSLLAAQLALNLGVGHLENAQLADAENQFRRGLAEAQRGGHRGFEAEACWQLARTALQLHLPEQAAQQCRLALQLAHKLGHRWLECVAHQTWAEIALSRGEREDALRSAHASLALARQIHARAQESQAHKLLAQLLQDSGDSAAALQHLWQHLDLREALERLGLPERMVRLAHYDLAHKPPEEMLLELSNRHWRIDSEADVIYAAGQMREAALRIMQLDALHFWWASERAGELLLYEAGSEADPPGERPRLAAPAQAGYLQLLDDRREVLALHELRLHPCQAELARLAVPALAAARSRIEIPLFVQNRLVALLWLEQTQRSRHWSRQDLLQASHLGRLYERLLVGHDLACAQHAQWLMEQEKADALGRLVAGVAHEVNTPIGVAVTAASSVAESAQQLSEALRGERVSRQQLTELAQRLCHGADLVERNLQRAAALILNFKQVTVDQASEAVSQFVLLDYLRSVLSVLSPALRKARAETRLEVDPAIELQMAAGLLTQVLSNLIMNCLNHAFVDGRGGLIRISARLDGRHVLIDVADDGVGASADVRARMFEPFFTTKRGRGGSGLGLYIVQSLVQRLEGSIELPAVERGLCVRLRLPRGRL